jgi:transcription antitermination factor NusG
MQRTSVCRDGDWVAVMVRTHYERVAATQLERHGYELFLPLYTPHGSRARTARTPLFSGYLFCRYAVAHPFRIIQAPGVLRILSADGRPASVPEEEVESVRRVVLAGVAAEPCPMLGVGERVRVIAGPLAGLCGTLLATHARTRVVVSVSILRRAVAAEVAIEQLERMEAAA